MKLLKELSIGLIFPLVYLIVLSLSGFKHVYTFPTVVVIFFISSIFLYKFFHKSNSLQFFFWRVNWLMTLLLMISSFTGGFPASAVYLLVCLTVSFLGIKFFNSIYKMGYIFLVITLGVAGGTFLLPASHFAYQNRNSHIQFEHPPLYFLTSDYDTLHIDPEVVTVLDNWHVYCGPCFKKFPELNKLHLEYADNPDVAVFALNSPQRLDHPDSVRALVQDLNYDFPVLYAVNTKEVQSAFRFNGYPHLVILKNGKVHYGGLFASDWNEPFADPRKIINRLLEES